MNSISERIKVLTEIETKIEDLNREYERKKQELKKAYGEEQRRIMEEFSKDIETKKSEIRERITIQYNSKAQNMKMYYESVSFKPLNKDQLAELFISILRREIDEIRKNI